jgi:flavodoxin
MSRDMSSSVSGNKKNKRNYNDSSSDESDTVVNKRLASLIAFQKKVFIKSELEKGNTQAIADMIRKEVAAEYVEAHEILQADLKAAFDAYVLRLAAIAAEHSTDAGELKKSGGPADGRRNG